MDTQNTEQVTAEDILRMTADVVSAYLSNNLLPASQISEVIQTVHTSLNALGVGPGGAYVASLEPDARIELRERCRAALPRDRIRLTSHAWAARGSPGR